MYRLIIVAVIGLTTFLTGCSVVYTTLARGIQLDDGSYVVLHYGRLEYVGTNPTPRFLFDGIKRQEFYQAFPDGGYLHLGTEILVDDDPEYPPGIGVYDEENRQLLEDLARAVIENPAPPIKRDDGFVVEVRGAIQMVTGQEPREIKTTGPLIFPEITFRSPGSGDEPARETTLAYRVNHGGFTFVVMSDRVDEGGGLSTRFRITETRIYQFTADGRYRHLGTYNGVLSDSPVDELGLGVYSEADRDLIWDVIDIWAADDGGGLVEEDGLGTGDIGTTVEVLTGRSAKPVDSPGDLIFSGRGEPPEPNVVPVPTPDPTPVPDSPSFGGIDESQGD